MRAWRLFIMLAGCVASAEAQTIQNGSLTGPTGLSTVPLGWEHLFPNVDTEDQNGPHELYNLSPDGGTFVAGANAVTQPPLGVEAFQQVVGGFVPGNWYRLVFFQSNLGFGVDDVGGTWGALASWRLYLDGVAEDSFSAPMGATTGPLPNNVWSAGSIVFMARSTTHAVGLGPHSYQAKNAFLGIDGIAIDETVPVTTTSWGGLKSQW
jgi:hypothetical protein